MRSFETEGVTLERLSEYRNLEIEDIDPLYEPEKDHSDEHDRLVNWPSEGRIEAIDLSARYAPEMPDILHKVSFSCNGGQRIGIVGATGGGKSTLAKTLFRFVEISGGTITIDDEGKQTRPYYRGMCVLTNLQTFPASPSVSSGPGWASSLKTRSSSVGRCV